MMRRGRLAVTCGLLLALVVVVRRCGAAGELLRERDGTRCSEPDHRSHPRSVQPVGGRLLKEEHEIHCDVSETMKYKIEVIPGYYSNLYCSSIDRINIKDIPCLNLSGDNELSGTFYISDCPLLNETYSELIRHLGFISTPTIVIKGVPVSIQRRHLKGLDELGVTKLKISNGNVTVLPEDLFSDMRQLKTLDLSQNEVRVQGAALAALTSLENLHLSSSGLTGVGDELWGRGLPALLNLYLERNRLELEDSSLVGLPRLQVLSLRENGLHSLPQDVFASLARLTYVDLGHNLLQGLPKDLFKHNQNLEVLKLSGNKITALRAEIFGSLIKMDSEAISELTDFRKPVKLKDLDISFNKIGSLPENVFKRLRSLKNLNLNGNSIESLKRKTFADLDNLETLSMRSNRLSTETDWALIYPQRLRNLDFSRNHITRILGEWQHDIRLYNLVSLDLSSNHIQYIDKFVNDLDFRKHQRLEVNLNHNNISRIYLPDFDNMNPPHAVNISMDGNPIICDCHLSDFVEYQLKAKDTVASTKVTFNTGHATCSGPRNLTHRLLSIVDRCDLTCEYKSMNCSLIEQTCTKANIIDCSNLKPDAFDTFDKILTGMKPEYGYTYTDTELNFENTGIVYHQSLASAPKNDTLLILRGTNLTFTDQAISKHMEDLLLRDTVFVNLSESAAAMILFGSNKLKVPLSSNMYFCNCEAQNSINILQNKTVKVQDFNLLKCQPITPSSKHLFKTVEFALQCRGREDNRTIITVTITSAVLILLLAIVYHFRRRIPGLNSYISETTPNIAQKKKDVFLSYSQCDYNLMQNLKNTLHKHGYTTIDHCEDWKGGCHILDSITESIRITQITIFLVTKSFVESRWTTHEFREAFSTQIRERKGTRMLVVVKGDIKDLAKRDIALEGYIKQFTYLELDRPDFEKRLVSALPKRLADIISESAEESEDGSTSDRNSEMFSASLLNK